MDGVVHIGNVTFGTELLEKRAGPEESQAEI